MELPADGEVKHWRIPQVVEWLTENRMEVYVEDFRNNYVDGELLLRLREYSLKEMNVHPTHIKQILDATKTYRYYNPENDYEFSSDDDDNEEFEDDDATYSLGDNYIPPDVVEEVSQSGTRRPPPTARREEEEEDGDSADSYEVPDDDMVPPPRNNFVGTRGMSSSTSNSQFQHRPPPPPRAESEPEQSSVNGRGFRPAPSPPSTNSSKGGRLPSIPNSMAPLPPTKGKGNRPPAPLPSSDKHVSVDPSVPLTQSLDGLEVYEDPDITPDMQSAAPPVNSSQHPGMMGVGRKPLPPTPGNSSPMGVGGRSHPPVGGSRGGQYPLVTLPTKDQRSPTPTKVIQSYTDHQLPTTHAPTQPRRPDHTLHTQSPAPRLPAPHKPAVAANRPALSNKPIISTKPPVGDAVDSSSMSIKDRMALLQGQNVNSGVKPAGSGGNSQGDLMKQMMNVQRERNNVGSGVGGSGKSITTPAGAACKPLAVAAPRTRTHPAVSKVETAPPPLPASSHPTLPSLPIGFIASPAHSKPKPPHSRQGPPPVPMSSHPRQRDSVESASSQSTDEDQGLYSYSWYKSDMDRTTSMTILKRRRGERGVFIVRKSTKDATKPYTLDVMYEDSDFHIPLRKRTDGKFAMGTYQENEDCWSSVAELVTYFMHNNLKLTKKAPDGTIMRKSTPLIN